MVLWLFPFKKAVLKGVYMKVNKIFHWLYFLMLLLPIFAIPMYAIYVRNENSTFAQEITVQENKAVDFNQKFTNFSENWYLYDPSISTLTVSDNSLTATVTSDNGGQGWQFGLRYPIIATSNHKYLVSFIGNVNAQSSELNFGFSSNVDLIFVQVTGSKQEFIIDVNYELVSWENFAISFHPSYQPTVGDSFSLTNLQLFDLTQMFGEGNEPTTTQFIQWYPNDYYEYTLSDKQLLKSIDQTTYNDTDVGSQFTYTIYNSINKYFNYDKVFNFGDLYDWLQLNFFNGNAPIGFFIFWHYLIYFLLTSLLWLLFDVLMYVPNLIHKWLDKAS